MVEKRQNGCAKVRQYLPVHTWDMGWVRQKNRTKKNLKRKRRERRNCVNKFAKPIFMHVGHAARLDEHHIK